MRINLGIAAVALAGALLAAAPPLRADDAMGGHRQAMGSCKDRFGMLKDQLGLTDHQVKSWKEAEKGQRDKIRVLKDKISADVSELKVLVDEQATDPQLTQALQSLESDHQSLHKLQLARIGTLKGILSPMQQAELVLLCHDHAHCKHMSCAHGDRSGHHGDPKHAQDGAQD